MSIVDVWTQVTTERMAAEPWLQTLNRWTRRPGGEPQTPEATLAAMDEAGVEIALLAAWHGPSGSLISASEVAECVAVAPGRFRGMVAPNLFESMGAVREIRRCVLEQDFIAVRIVPWLWDLPPNDRLYYPIYSACVDLGIPVCTQIGHTGPLRPSDSGRLIPYLEQVMLDFPELVVVGGHVGFPWIDELVTMTVKFENFYVDTSAYALHRLPRSFVDWMTTVGRDRVMFGSNWPMLRPARCLVGLEQLGLDERTRSGFLGDTARRVFRLPGRLDSKPDQLEQAHASR